MSSGRSGYFGDTIKSPAEIRDEAERAASNTAFDREVNDLLGKRLATVNDRDPVLTRERLDHILDVLGAGLEDRLETQMGGSLSKHTYLEGLSDVDTLVLLSNADLIDRAPGEVRSRFADILRAKLAMTGVSEIAEGTLAVSVRYDDGSVIQLLPAVRTGSDIRISDPTGQRWSQIRPQDFAKRLTRANEAMAGRLVPVIKLAKLIVSSFPEERRLSGYHIESLAIDAFRGFAGSMTYKVMLQHFFARAAQRVRAPMSDSTGQSVHVDDDLGAVDSLSRRLAADSLGAVARRMATSRSVQDWNGLIAEPES